MKKILSLALALVLVFTVTAVVFANLEAGVFDETTSEIVSENFGNIGEFLQIQEEIMFEQMREAENATRFIIRYRDENARGNGGRAIQTAFNRGRSRNSAERAALENRIRRFDGTERQELEMMLESTDLSGRNGGRNNRNFASFTAESFEILETELPLTEVIILDEAVNAEDFIAEVMDEMGDSIEFIQEDIRMELADNDLDLTEIESELEIDLDMDSEWEWNLSVQSPSSDATIVAIIDTGIDTTHPMLVGRFVDGWDFVNNTSEVFNPDLGAEQNHGTHIVGIIAQTAPDVRIMPLKVFENGVAYTSDIIAAIQFAEANGATIVNASWGATGYNPALREVIESSNMFFVAAAGNHRMDLNETPIYPASFDLPNVISVASTNQDFGMSFFSNFGPVDIAAVGRNVESTVVDGEMGTMTGTSVSAAFVSAAAAMTDADDIRGALMSSADRLSSLQNWVTDGNFLNIDNLLAGVEGQALTVNYEDDFDRWFERSVAESWELFNASPTVQIAAGLNHTVALKVNGTVWAWGNNGAGRLGTGHSIYVNRNIPTQVIGLRNIAYIAAGDHHTIALTNDGNIYAWGNHGVGQLGIGYSFPNHTRPVPVNFNFSGRITAVAARTHHTFALTSEGYVYAWGNNWTGQLGVGDAALRRVPTRISNFNGVTSITTGARHTIATKDGGAVYIWGRNNIGNRPPETPIFDEAVAVSIGGRHKVTIRGQERAVYTWGENWYGELGVGDRHDRNIPTQVIGLSDIADIAAGYSYTVALTNDGNVYAWGSNRNGQLGIGNTIAQNAPVQIANLSGVTQIAAGGDHTVALTENGYIYTWGSNAYGQLGLGLFGGAYTTPQRMGNFNVYDEGSIIVTESTTITLNNTHILAHQPFVIDGAHDVVINLIGNNTLTALNGAGIHVPHGASLTINGPGSLTATAGGGHHAGIGGIAYEGSVTHPITPASGTITINGGTIIAEGSGNGAGIGAGGRNSGSVAASGVVTINDGTVTAFAGNGTGAGIGGGGVSPNSTAAANSSNNNGVHINGGTVIADARGRNGNGGGGAGIGTGNGAGNNGTDYAGIINIGANADVTAFGAGGGAGIGMGGAPGHVTLSVPRPNNGQITIDGTVRAFGSGNGAGIGGGGSNAGRGGTITGEIIFNSNANVIAISAGNGAGIGGGGGTYGGGGMGLGTRIVVNSGARVVADARGNSEIGLGIGGAGIGGGATTVVGGTWGHSGTFRGITIHRNAVVEAFGAGNGAGIGGGGALNNIGMGGNASMSGINIFGEVTTVGAGRGAGVGGGGSNAGVAGLGGNILISGTGLDASSTNGVDVGGGTNNSGVAAVNSIIRASAVDGRLSVSGYVPGAASQRVYIMLFDSDIRFITTFSANIDERGLFETERVTESAPGTMYVIRMFVGMNPLTGSPIHAAEVPVVVEGNADATLSALSVDGHTLSPNFSPEITDYTVIVPYSVMSIDIAATPTHSGSTMIGAGTRTLNVGNNVLEVVVTAENRTVMIYTITVTRQPSNLTVGTAIELQHNDFLESRFKQDTHSTFYSYTPARTGLYVFEAFGEIGTTAFLYSASDLNRAIVSDVNKSGVNNNFRIAATLEAGRRYYLRVESINSGRYSLNLSNALSGIIGTVYPAAIGNEATVSVYTHDGDFVAMIYLGSRARSNSATTPFFLSGIPNGSYELRIEQPGYLTWTRDITLNNNALNIGTVNLVANNSAPLRQFQSLLNAFEPFNFDETIEDMLLQEESLDEVYHNMPIGMEFYEEYFSEFDVAFSEVYDAIPLQPTFSEGTTFTESDGSIFLEISPFIQPLSATAPTSATFIPYVYLTHDMAIIRGNVPFNNGVRVDRVQFGWGTDPNRINETGNWSHVINFPTWYTNEQRRNEVGGLINIPPINSGRVYYFVIVAQNANGEWGWSAPRRIAGFPNIVTDPTSWQSNGGYLRGSISNRGLSAVTEAGFFWGFNSENVVNMGGATQRAVFRGAIPNVGAFSHWLNNPLQRPHYYMAYARNQHGISLGGLRVVTPPAPTFTISATPTAPNFGSHQIGYTQRPAQTVTITNTGNQNVTLNALPSVANWTLVQAANWRTSFAPGQTRTFTIRPNNGLGVGTYNPTITISGNGGASVQVRPTFTVTQVPTFSISATPTAPNFGSHQIGYTQRPAQTVTVTNTGNQNVTLNALPNVPNWTLTPAANWRTSFAPNQTRTFTIRPNHGLPAGSYDTTITISGSGGASVQVRPTFTVTPAPQATPTVTSVTVNPRSATVVRGSGFQFSASVQGTNTPPQTVRWTIDGNPAGATINANGFLTVNANATMTTLTVRATSTHTQTVSGTATVIVNERIPTIPPGGDRFSSANRLSLDGGIGLGNVNAGDRFMFTFTANETGAGLYRIFSGGTAGVQATLYDRRNQVSRVIGTPNFSMNHTLLTGLTERVYYLEIVVNTGGQLNLFIVNERPHAPYLYRQWGLRTIGVIAEDGSTPVWDISTGAGVTVAVIDTGFHYNHQDLRRNIRYNDSRSFGTVTNRNHGTHVAGIIAAERDNGTGIVGVAPDAQIVPISIMTDLEGTGETPTVLLFPAIVHARETGSRVVNMSIGGAHIPNAVFYSEAIRGAIYASSHILFVCSAGNFNSEIPIFEIYPDLTNIISVANVNELGELGIFNNRFIFPAEHRPMEGARAHVAAPGTNILSTFYNNVCECADGNPYCDFDIYGRWYSARRGTSYAAPHVAGIAALIFSRYPHLTGVQVMQIIKDTVTSLRFVPDRQFVRTGGIVNAYAALREASRVAAITPAVAFNEVATPPRMDKSRVNLDSYYFGVTELLVQFLNNNERHATLERVRLEIGLEYISITEHFDFVDLYQISISDVAFARAVVERLLADDNITYAGTIAIRGR